MIKCSSIVFFLFLSLKILYLVQTDLSGLAVHSGKTLKLNDCLIDRFTKTIDYNVSGELIHVSNKLYNYYNYNKEDDVIKILMINSSH